MHYTEKIATQFMTYIACEVLYSS